MSEPENLTQSIANASAGGVAVVTGSGGGLGAALVKLAGAAGMKFVVADIRIPAQS